MNEVIFDDKKGFIETVIAMHEGFRLVDCSRDGVNKLYRIETVDQEPYRHKVCYDLAEADFILHNFDAGYPTCKGCGRVADHSRIAVYCLSCQKSMDNADPTALYWPTDTIIVTLTPAFKQTDLETLLEVIGWTAKQLQPEATTPAPLAEFYNRGRMVVYCYTDRACKVLQASLNARKVTFVPADIA